MLVGLNSLHWFNPKESPAVSKTGKQIPKDRELSIRELSPDDPIFRRGFVIGAKPLIPFSRATPASNSPSAKEKQQEKPTKGR
jgi:hypothetical protein